MKATNIPKLNKRTRFVFAKKGQKFQLSTDPPTSNSDPTTSTIITLTITG